MHSFARMIVRIFRPKACYKPWYTMNIETQNHRCDCLFTCKYPPPSAKQPVYVPNKKKL